MRSDTHRGGTGPRRRLDAEGHPSPTPSLIAGPNPVLCGIDGGTESVSAAALADSFRNALNVGLVAVHAIRPTAPVAAVGTGFPLPPLEAESDVLKTAGEHLAASVVQRAGVADARIRVVEGHPAEAILSTVKAEAAQLIVVGTRGRGSFVAALLGSVSGEVACRSPVPTAVTRSRGSLQAFAAGGPVVCCVDVKGPSGGIVSAAHLLAKCLNRRLILVSAAPLPTAPGLSAAVHSHERLFAAERREAQDALLEAMDGIASCSTADIRVVAGRDSALRDIATAEHASLLVVGTSRRGAIAAAAFGSVSRELMATAPCPVVVVPPEAERDQEQSNRLARDS